jgi:hypothetical protein
MRRHEGSKTTGNHRYILGGSPAERVSSAIYKQMQGFLRFFEIVRDKVRGEGRVPHGEQPNRRKAEYEPPMSFLCRNCYTGVHSNI